MANRGDRRHARRHVALRRLGGGSARAGDRGCGRPRLGRSGLPVRRVGPRHGIRDPESVGVRGDRDLRHRRGLPGPGAPRSILDRRGLRRPRAPRRRRHRRGTPRHAPHRRIAAVHPRRHHGHRAPARVHRPARGARAVAERRGVWRPRGRGPAEAGLSGHRPGAPPGAAGPRPRPRRGGRPRAGLGDRRRGAGRGPARSHRHDALVRLQGRHRRARDAGARRQPGGHPVGLPRREERSGRQCPAHPRLPRRARRGAQA